MHVVNWDTKQMHFQFGCSLEILSKRDKIVSLLSTTTVKLSTPSLLSTVAH